MKKGCFLLLLSLNSVLSQQTSYFRMNPAIDKDTIEIINERTIKYDITVYWNESRPIMKSNGQIALLSAFDIENPHGSFTVFSYNERKMELRLPPLGRLKKAAPGNPNRIDFDIIEYPFNTLRNTGPFSVEGLKAIFSNAIFNQFSFNTRDNELLFFNEKKQSFVRNLGIIEVFLSKKDIRDIYVYDNAGKFILKLSWQELMQD
ncbi:MAG: hypothetical protein PSV16_00955 [Flavobacterium sp.]|nr:hypothetical protein [Flavobacterium sp.]